MWQNSICGKTKQLRIWHNLQTPKLKNSKCDNSKTQNVTKLKNSKCDNTQKLTKLKNTKCDKNKKNKWKRDKTKDSKDVQNQTLKMWQNANTEKKSKLPHLLLKIFLKLLWLHATYFSPFINLVFCWYRDIQDSVWQLIAYKLLYKILVFLNNMKIMLMKNINQPFFQVLIPMAACQ